jgi:hypothetical protein
MPIYGQSDELEDAVATAQDRTGGRSGQMFVMRKEDNRPEKYGDWLWACML